MRGHTARDLRVGLEDEVPDGVQHDRDHDDPGAPQRTSLQDNGDEHAGGERYGDLGESERGDQQRTGDQIAAAVGALDREKGADAERNRGGVADLERTEEVLVGRAHHQYRQHRGERDPVSDAPAQVDEEEEHACEKGPDGSDRIGKDRVHSDSRLNRLVDERWPDDQVPRMRIEQCVRVEPAAREEQVPVVDQESEV